MSVFPTKDNAVRDLFGRDKVLIGVIHSLALPGSPHYEGQPLDEIYRYAAEEAEAYEAGGFHGVIVENAWDLPFSKPGDLGHETAATMAAMTAFVRARTDLPVGVNILANGVECALAAAKAAGGRFVRANQWVNAYVANEGFVEGPSARATRYRTWLRAQDIKVFADVHVKHGSHAIVADRSVPEQAADAEFFDADVLIATGNRTGGATEASEVEAIRAGSSLPVIIGSGITVENGKELFAVADGAIVGSSVKENERWWGRVSPDRVRDVVKVAEEVWS